jgi:hypothetical protein
LLWVLAWIVVAIWSLFAWGAYGLLDLFGGVAVRNADVVSNHPETVEWLSWALAALRGLGLGAIVVIWGFVSLLILAVPAAIGLLLGRAGSPASHYPQAGYQGARYPDARMRDVTPGSTGGGYPPASGNPTRRIEKR